MDAKQAARTATRPSRLDAIHIAGLWSLAVAQPVFDILRGSPEFFVAHDTGPGGLLALVLVVCLAGPVGCLLALSLAGRFAPRWRRRAAVVVIGGLVAAITLAAIRQLADWSSVPSLATAAACGTFAIIGYIRLAPVRLFATFLAPAAVVVPTVFLLHPAIAGLLSPSDRQGPLDGVTFVSTPPVVVVIFDQLPLPSLLDRASRIDRALYPNFAALADGATWFRNASTVSGYTSFALPAILTGAYPEPSSLPVAADHPANLFTLLGGRYRLHVQEPLTELCPETLCQPARAGPAGWLAGVLSDLAVVYLTVVLPEDLAAPLPPVTQGWRDFAARDTLLHRWLAPRPGPRDTVTTFIDSLTAETAAAGSTLHFMHVLLPHHPWLYLPTGQRFTTHRGDIGLQNGRWVDDKWAGALRYQRHLLQVQYVDTVVGALVARLRQVGMYDDALLVVTADHGTSLRPGFPFLQPTEASFVDFAAVPLFIKRPGQRRGEVIDANIETIDILPTLAAELGVRLPWTTDGLNALDPAEINRPVKKLFVGGSPRWMEAPADLGRAVMERVSRKLAVFGTGNPMDQPGPGGRGDLIGQRAADYPAPRATDIEVAIDAPELLSAVDLAGDFLPAHITGTAVAPEGAPPPLLAITLDGVVVAITRPYPFRAFGRDDTWEAIIDPRLLQPGANAVGVFAVRERADGTVVLAEAYAAADARPAINLVREEATELWDVTAAGFHATEWSEGRTFRWTTGAARITVPIDPQAPPAELVVDVLMTGQSKGLRIEADGCVLFDDTIRNRWTGTFALDACRLAAPTLEIELLSDTHVPDTSDDRTLGVGVAAVELRTRPPD